MVYSKKQISSESSEFNDNSDEVKKELQKIVTGISSVDSAQISTNNTARQFAKPDRFTGNRSLYASNSAQTKVKIESFANEKVVRDPYTGKRLELKMADAKAKYGDKWAEHLAEGDHKVPVEKIHSDYKNNPFLKNEDIREIVNSPDNLETVSRKYNNAKRSRTNEELINDDSYLKKTNLKLSDSGKKKAIDSGRNAQRSIDRKVAQATVKNAAQTFHSAGMNASIQTGGIVGVMSGISNITAVIQGEKSAENALIDTAVDTGKAAATSYVMGGGLTTVSHCLASSSSKFVQGLAKSNVPGKVITAVILTGETLRRYGNGEITTQECIIELGEKGLNFAVTGYSMAVGQALIPIPIVGAAVGALVGSALTSGFCGKIINTLKTKELEHEERLRLIAEYNQAAEQERLYREELEQYLNSYFQDYQDCFDSALDEIYLSLQDGDIDGVISGTNKITQKLNGKTYYDSFDEFKSFIDDDSKDYL